MPNWCYNRIAIYTEEEKGQNQIIDLYIKLMGLSDGSSLPKEYAGKKDKVATGWSYGDWYGSLLLMQGHYTEKEIEENFQVRGTIQEIELEEHVGLYFIYLFTETAWEPMIETIVELLADYPDLRYEYCSEEPGNGIWINTDISGEFFKERYRLDFVIDPWSDKIFLEPEYYSNERDFLAGCEELADALATYKDDEGDPAFKPFDKSTYESEDFKTMSDEHKAFEIVDAISDYFNEMDDTSQYAGGYITANKFDES